MNVNLFAILRNNLDINQVYLPNNKGNKLVYNFGPFPCEVLKVVLEKTNITEYFVEFSTDQGKVIPKTHLWVKRWMDLLEDYCNHRTEKDLYTKGISFHNNIPLNEIWWMYDSVTLSTQMNFLCDIPDYFFFESLIDINKLGIFVLLSDFSGINFNFLLTQFNNKEFIKVNLTKLLQDQNLNRLITFNPRKESLLLPIYLIEDQNGCLTTIQGASNLYTKLINNDTEIEVKIIQLKDMEV